ncbi:hypothetical protein JAAARDRAFT_36537 [Jaapia argillacea MUCL 33604]|uniref:Mid2 domain-containing protein n=1 Tax=Jaapia argillacea MUCL 33604 TaxID=933084 RepID=A0A067PYK9_9AGAM|nr:hypothetical protein JAAARDRAFT_36537 [Jaapia argillacea MUCL 33604]
MLARLALTLTLALGVLSQSITQPADVTTTAPAPGATQTECWAYESLPGGVASVSLGPDEAVPTNGLCWEIYSTGGGVASVPIATVISNPIPGPPILPSAIPAVPASGSLETTQNHNLTVVLPAVLGTVGGLVLLGGLALFVTRRKTRREAEKKRAWVNRPGTWVPDVESAQIPGPVTLALKPVPDAHLSEKD